MPATAAQDPSAALIRAELHGPLHPVVMHTVAKVVPPAAATADHLRQALQQLAASRVAIADGLGSSAALRRASTAPRSPAVPFCELLLFEAPRGPLGRMVCPEAGLRISRRVTTCTPNAAIIIATLEREVAAAEDPAAAASDIETGLIVGEMELGVAARESIPLRPHTNSATTVLPPCTPSAAVYPGRVPLHMPLTWQASRLRNPGVHRGRRGSVQRGLQLVWDAQSCRAVSRWCRATVQSGGVVRPAGSPRTVETRVGPATV